MIGAYPVAARPVGALPVAAAAGTTYNDTLTETVTSSDSLANAQVFASALTETVTPADTDNSAQVFVAGFSDSVTLADAYSYTVTTGGFTYNDTLAEALTLADSLIASQAMGNPLTETVTLSDGASVTVIMAPTLGEAIAVAESLGATQIMVSTVGETVTLNATLTSTVSGSAVWPDPTTVLAGTQYGPTGLDYTGTLSPGGAYLRRR